MGYRGEGDSWQRVRGGQREQVAGEKQAKLAEEHQVHV